MRILVTGAYGFVGRNLVTMLRNQGYNEIYEFDKDCEAFILEDYLMKADFVFHLAGVNRPEQEAMFMEGNAYFTMSLLNTLKKRDNPCPVLYSSSVQAALNNPYGASKRAGEAAVAAYARDTGAKIYIYRFPNIFGKWCRPNYNSVVATFCYNIAYDQPITIEQPDRLLELVYIDDLINELLLALKGKANKCSEFCEVPVTYTVILKSLANMIQSFHDSRNSLKLPDMSNEFTKKLYSTYLTYLPEKKLSYELKMNTDQRGSFTEFLKQPELGQLSVNILRPGIIKGNHWHNTKNEKFLVVSGYGSIKLRSISSKEIIEYKISSEKLEVVDIPPGYTHSIENSGGSDMVVIIWANEEFDKAKQDTYYMEV